jgi:hypothetical protein
MKDRLKYGFKIKGGKFTWPLDKDNFEYHYPRGFDDCERNPCPFLEAPQRQSLPNIVLHYFSLISNHHLCLSLLIGFAMTEAQRHQILLDLLAQTGFVTVEQVISRLGISPATARRDINKRDESGRLKKSATAPKPSASSARAGRR